MGTEVELGMLGIAISKNQQGKTFVFLYYTEADSSGIVIGNRLYRYELIDNKLVNPLLLLNLPATSPIVGHENNHNGGKVVIGPDNNVYLVVGDVGGRMGNIQNIMRGTPDGTSGILRVTQDGKSVHNGPFGSSVPNILYYAYGIRNSLDLILILLLVTYGIVKTVELIRMKLIMSTLDLIVVGERPWVWLYRDLIPTKIYFILTEKEITVIPNLYGRKLLLRPPLNS